MSKIIELSPGNAAAYFGRGSAYLAKGDLGSAIKDFDKSLAIDSGNEEAYAQRGIANAKAGNLDQAISDFTSALTIHPSGDVFFNRAKAYGNKSQYAEALSDYTHTIQMDPGNGAAYQNRAIINFALQDYEKSWADVHKAESLGQQLNPQFLMELKNRSGQMN